MWVQLTNEFLNLEHIVRVRFNRGWKNGKEELVAELDGFIKGEIAPFSRYRSEDAQLLLQALAGMAAKDALASRKADTDPDSDAADDASQANVNTIGDFQLPQ